MKHAVNFFLAAAAVALVACGSTAGSPAVSQSSSQSSPAADVAGARATASTIFYPLPNQTPEIWLPCSAEAANFAKCPFSAAVKARLDALSAAGFGGDVPPGCAEDYITATQNGLNTAPEVTSAKGNAGGTVTVVIGRGVSPDLTATMTNSSGAWLASDLASGTGPSASIFSAKPNC
jgi:hypothetical protein